MRVLACNVRNNCVCDARKNAYERVRLRFHHTNQTICGEQTFVIHSEKIKCFEKIIFILYKKWKIFNIPSFRFGGSMKMFSWCDMPQPRRKRKKNLSRNFSVVAISRMQLSIWPICVLAFLVLASTTQTSGYSKGGNSLQYLGLVFYTIWYYSIFKALVKFCLTKSVELLICG